ncbi:MAG: hypothetical protein BWY65_01655 [Firmicutes bacterium ADurb.Bin373]|nr:MAG: hypothetical protein BWY65_01655 [Firmicutes bacterium ADurb.Bin373]
MFWVEKTFGLKSFFQLFKGQVKRARPVRLNFPGIKLVRPVTLVNRNVTTHYDSHTVIWTKD